jgi:hypothetical protein
MSTVYKYAGISPKGKLNYFNNQKDFAKKYDLNYKCISACLNNRQNTHKKWLFYYYNEWKQKSTYVGISPSGKVHIFNNQSEFARKHNLRSNNISACINKTANFHKGWKFYIKQEWDNFSKSIKNNIKKYKTKKPFYIGIDSNGEIYKFSNQNRFAKKHNLLQESISDCVNKKFNFHYGWDFYKYDEWNNFNKKKKQKIINKIVSPNYIGINPKGNVYEFNNQRKFAKKHNLSANSISASINKNHIHNGWYFLKYKKWNKMSEVQQEYVKENKKLQPKYIGIDKNNRWYFFNNQNKFANKNNLNQVGISQCLNKNQKTHREWKFYNFDDIVTLLSLSL